MAAWFPGRVSAAGIADPGASETGALTGLWDIPSEPSLVFRNVILSFGPAGNYRQHSISGPVDARAPVSEPQSWWTLPQLVPGAYSRLYGNGYVRRGRELTLAQTRLEDSTSVVAGPATVQVVNCPW